MIAQKYKNTLDKIKPYIFTHGIQLDQFDLKPFGYHIEDELCFDCTKVRSKNFFDHIIKMDEITFGDQGMGMDRWVLYDCSAMPGAIFGFAVQACDLTKEVAKKMGVDHKSKEYVPISMYIAIPTMEKDHWFGHNLSSLNAQLNRTYGGLGLLTKVFALESMRIQYQYGATQWNSPALFIHTKVSSLKLITSYTPIHTHHYSLTYLAKYTHEGLKSVLYDNLERDFEQSFELDGSNKEVIRKMQDQIEAGEEYYICGRPKSQKETTIYPIHHAQS